MPLPIRGGAYMSANQGIGGATLTQCVINTLDPTYPYSASLSGNGLVVRGAGPIRVICSVKVDSGLTCTATLKINGAAISPTGNTANISTLNYSYNAHAGDVLTLWETDSGTNNFTQNVNGGQANTFIHYEVPTDAPFPSAVFTRASFI